MSCVSHSKTAIALWLGAPCTTITAATLCRSQRVFVCFNADPQTILRHFPREHLQPHLTWPGGAERSRLEARTEASDSGSYSLMRARETQPISADRRRKVNSCLGPLSCQNGCCAVSKRPLGRRRMLDSAKLFCRGWGERRVQRAQQHSTLRSSLWPPRRSDLVACLCAGGNSG